MDVRSVQRGGRAEVASLCGLYARARHSQSNAYARAPIIGSVAITLVTEMLDIVFLLLGLGGFGLLGFYANLCSRL
ncbi:MAG: hypothetical protein AB7U75_17135 [Hyphomicrobiaceae bacterium]